MGTRLTAKGRPVLRQGRRVTAVGDPRFDSAVDVHSAAPAPHTVWYGAHLAVRADCRHLECLAEQKTMRTEPANATTDGSGSPAVSAQQRAVLLVCHQSLCVFTSTSG